MVDFSKIKFTELKKAVIAANASGVIPTNIRHVGVKGVKLYDEFVTAISDLEPDDQLRLPEDVIDFFNYAIEDDEPEETPELNFEEDPSSGDIEPNPEPEEIIGEDASIEDEPLEVAPPKIADKPKETQESAPKSDSTPNLDEKPKKKMKRLAKTVMTVKVEDSILTIAFKEFDVTKSFNLPSSDNVVAFKPIRKKAMDFANENGASAGQIAAISKTLNIAGYYVR